MDYREHILRLISMKGPVLPSHINRDLKRDTIFTGAMLSELVDNKKLKLTYLKVGGSPLYYLPGQEHRLQYFTKSMHEKEQKAYELLRKNTILADREQEPVIRAALREIRDFAVPLSVTVNDDTQLFWKWYLASAGEAEARIREKMAGNAPPPSVSSHSPAPLSSSVPSSSSHSSSHSSPPLFSTPLSSSSAQVPAPSSSDPIREHRRMLLQQLGETPVQETSGSAAPPDSFRSAPHQPASFSASEKKEQQGAQPEEGQKVRGSEKNMAGRSENREPLRHSRQKPVRTLDTRDLQKKLDHEEKKPAFVEPADDHFYITVKKYLDTNSIVLKKLSIVRKNNELTAEIVIPSSIGPLDFYCKAKNKLRCTEGDLSTAFLEGQRKKLPVLFLTTGEISKKATTLLTSELRSVTVKTLAEK